MPITTNNSLSSGSPDLSSGTENNHAGGASGVEVPVVVHASRYSGSGASMGKSLPPVHEETRTVIVFDQGAVVRLSASMSSGEVVVLTNKLTGADVICKVTSVKAQPGIQNYVSLEFTQRAPGFWGASASTPSSNVPAPAVQTAPSVVAPPLLARPAAEIAPPPKPAPVAAIPSEPVAAKPPAAPAVSYEPESVDSITTEPIASAPSVPISTAPAGKTFGTSSTFGLGQSSAVPSNLRPVEFGTQSSSGSAGNKNMALIAVAAVALLVLGGVGGWLLMRPSHSAAPVDQAARSTEAPAAQPAATSQLELPAEPAVAPAPVAEPLAASSSANNRPELRSESRSEQPAVQPTVAKSASEPLAASSSAAAASSPKSAAPVAAPPAARRTAINVTTMAAPSVKRAVASTSSEAPPEVLAQPGTVSGGSLNDNLLATSARNSGPAAPAPSLPYKGGQIMEPRLISSPAPTYPVEARSARIQGDVVIDAFIDETGKVTATKVISGPPQLQQAAMSTIRTWKYQPARLDGQPISTHIRVNITFRLQ